MNFNASGRTTWESKKYKIRFFFLSKKERWRRYGRHFVLKDFPWKMAELCKRRYKTLHWVYNCPSLNQCLSDEYVIRTQVEFSVFIFAMYRFLRKFMFQKSSVSFHEESIRFWCKYYLKIVTKEENFWRITTMGK